MTLWVLRVERKEKEREGDMRAERRHLLGKNL